MAIPVEASGQPVYVMKENVARRTGDEALANTLTVSIVLEEITKTALGPSGFNKMLVGSFGDITYTKNGVTILSEANIEHPVGKLYIEAAKNLDKMVGDGTNRMIYLASKLIETGVTYYKKGIHPTTIALGSEEARKFLNEYIESISKKPRLEEYDTVLKNMIRTVVLPSIGRSELAYYENVVNAILQAAKLVTREVNGKKKIDIDDVAIVSKTGGSAFETSFINGIIIDKEVAHPNMPKRITGARIALIDFPLEVKKTEISSELEFKSPEEILKLKEEERRSVTEKVEKIIQSGANVLISQKAIDDKAAAALAKAGVLAVKNAKRSDLEKLAEATGARIVSDYTDISEKTLGEANLVEERKYEATEKVVVVEDVKKSKSVSILIRGVSKELTKEYERVVKKGLQCVANFYEDEKYVPSGVADIVGMAVALKDYGMQKGGEISLVIEGFSEALFDLAGAIVENSGMPVTKTIGDLRAKNVKTKDKLFGIDALSRKVVDVEEAGIIEPIKSVKLMLNVATELASTLLRVDDMFLTLKLPEKKEKGAERR
jgi:chaperonin GroEL (HSP60 family)